MAIAEPVLVADGLVKHYPLRGALPWRGAGAVHAVNGVNLVLRPGETVGLVGESGCGKSTLSQMLMLLTPPTRGRVLLGGEDTSRFSHRALRAFRRRVQMVFQDPYGSLNPRLTVRGLVREPLLINGLHRGEEAEARVSELLRLVGIGERLEDRHPTELSGGQRQRVAIARALVLRPDVLILDEPVASLDVSIQAQIINLLSEIQETLKVATLFISHDLSVVRQLADRVAVMYLGHIVEEGPADAIFESPSHPYTIALLSSVPGQGGAATGGRGPVLAGEVSSSTTASGCVFRSRCWKAQDICRNAQPALEATGGGARAACYFPERPSA